MTFNIQNFGTNDTVTSSVEIAIDWGFTDGDTRIAKIPNPRTDLTASDIQLLDTWVTNNQPIIGDKTGASSTGILSAVKIEQERRKLDLS